MVIFHAAALLYFLFFQTFPWFKLAPKAMPVQVGEKKLPDGYIIVGHYVAWIIVSAIIFNHPDTLDGDTTLSHPRFGTFTRP